MCPNVYTCLDKFKRFEIVKNVHNIRNIICLGIGDILFASMLYHNNLISAPIYINLNIFNPTNELGFPNPLNALEFRLNLIKIIHPHDYHEVFKLVDDEKLNNTMDTNVDRASYLTTFKLEIPEFHKQLTTFDIKLPDKYIVFHTKCRFTQGFNYTDLKNHMKEFCRNYKTDYKIILLGERIFSETWEARIHGITTIYNELKELESNNDVLDLTKEDIYNSLDIKNYMHDVNILKHATYNIHVGHGGQLCASLYFADYGILNLTIPLLLDTFPKLLTSDDNYNYFYNFKSFADKMNSL